MILEKKKVFKISSIIIILHTIHLCKYKRLEDPRDNASSLFGKRSALQNQMICSG